MRLLLCYLATHPGRFDAKMRSNWEQLAQLPPRDMATIANIEYLGVELKKSKSKLGFGFGRRQKGGRRFGERTGEDAQLLENGRFQPQLHRCAARLVASLLR